MKQGIRKLLRGTIASTMAAEASSLKPRQAFRSDTRWGRSVLEWPSLDVFLATAEVQPGVHSVPIGEFAGKQVNYDFLLAARLGKVLLCHFHGNAPREGSEFPIFTGLGVTSSIATSMFVPSDPVLALDASLSLAWHFGCEGIRLQAITVSIVKKLQAILQAPRVVAWGGSGGGFAAIRIARDVPNGIALVWNPQTDIEKYTPESVALYRSIAFPRIAAAGPIPSDGEQFPSLCTEAFRDGYQGRIVYLQESSDWHSGAHLDPFVASFCGKALSNMAASSKFSGFVTDQLYLHLGHWVDGHLPPSKDVLAKLLRLISDAAIPLEQLQGLACFPEELPDNTALRGRQAIPLTPMIEQNGTGTLSSVANDDPPLNLKEILKIRMNRLAEEFYPFDATVSCAGDRVGVPLSGGEVIEVGRSHGVQWDRKFVKDTNSSVMWLFSLDWVGRLMATFQLRKEEDALGLAVVAVRSFLDYSSELGPKSSIGRIPSADHSAATRVRVLIKFIQVMRERQDVDYALLERVCYCLKYWSDWICEDEHYAKNNHGLMASIALLHTAVQFGTEQCASRYLGVATNRIIELGSICFDRDGLCHENTIGYHNYNLQCYRRVMEFSKNYGLSGRLVRFLEELILRATEALEFCVWQDGTIPPIGDSSVYRPMSGSRLSSRNEPRCFHESGFAVVKNEDLYLSIQCSSRTEFHKQVDDSSITLRFKNHDILIDGGSYSYDRTDPHRRCVESSLGHTGLFLKEFDGLLRREFVRKYEPVSGKIERFEESSDGVRVSCRYSVRNGRFSFIRKIFVCWPDEVAIVDSVELKDMAGSPEPVQRFLFGPTFDVRFDERNKLILTSDGFSCTLFQLLDCEGILYRGEDSGTVRGWCSYKFKEILPTHAVDFVRISPVSHFSTVIKLANCVSLSECSTAVLAFADGRDPFVSTGGRPSVS